MSTSEAPPAYQKKAEATSIPANATSTSASNPTRTSHADTVERNGIPVDERRSMEDVVRPLPQGWIRQFDVKSGHHFYVDLRGSNPVSTWQHPATNSSSIPEPSRDSIEAETTDEDEPNPNSNRNQASSSSNKPPPTGLKKFGRGIKDKMTNSTHEERKQKRLKREEEERRAYQQHLAVRQAIMRAAQTGQPQLLGHDRSGKEVWVQPPPPDAFSRGYGYSPYNTGFGPGTYAAPGYAYGRRRGMGYGGGMGMGAPLLGLGGGLLLGAALF